MTHQQATAGDFGSRVLEWIEIASLAIEILAVTIIVTAIFYTAARYLLRPSARRENANWFHDVKTSLGRSLLLGLEVLVAADVVRTVALDWSFESVAVLGLLVLIRTILGWTLLVEIEGRWPWQGHSVAHGGESPVGETNQATAVHSGEVT